ncbi:hypothetical protein DVH24_024287 [Malus domestica]|uniref:Uncharacterized protein n=1 Tax=Malus domestica TaxID=3750 RepID=A0A498JLB9_MALDO|nr:hypothetical protein DVH24_024287 [Malus domestica]
MSEMPSNFSYLCRAFPYVCSEFPVLPIQPKGVLSFLSLLPFMCFTLPFSIFYFRASAFLGHCRCVPSFLSISSFLFRNFISGETRSLTMEPFYDTSTAFVQRRWNSKFPNKHKPDPTNKRFMSHKARQTDYARLALRQQSTFTTTHQFGH